MITCIIIVTHAFGPLLLRDFESHVVYDYFKKFFVYNVLIDLILIAMATEFSFYRMKLLFVFM